MSLTELCQIDGRFVALDVGRGAHLPEDGEHEGDNGQEGQREDPEDVQDVRNSVADGAGDSSAHAGPPRPVDLVPRRPGGQEAHKENHATQGTHGRAYNDEDHLKRFDP